MLDLASMISPPVARPTPGLCHQLEAAQLRQQLAALEARHELDLDHIRSLEARLDAAIRDWCALIIADANQAVQICGGGGSPGHAGHP